MVSIFREIVFMSIVGGILALILFCILHIFKNNISKTFQYYIWLVVLFMLVIPFDIEITPEQKVSNYIPTISIRNVVEYPDKISITDDKDGLQQVPIENTKNPISQFVTLFAYVIWPLGLILSLLYTIISYIRFNFVLNKTNIVCKKTEKDILEKLSNNKKIEIYKNPSVKTPMLVGLIKPKIILPNDTYSEQQILNIFLHELTHLRRLDILYKWFCVITCALHWFNPIVYVMQRQINKACELSCDEAVIKNLDQEGKQNYGETLISFASETPHKKIIISTTMCQEKKTLKERLVAIMKHKKTTKKVLILSSILLTIVIFIATVLNISVSEKTLVSTADKEAMFGYDLDKLSKHKSLYMGDNSNTSAIASLLPVPNINLVQKFTSMGDDYGTGNKPYTLTLYYETKKDGNFDLERELEKQNGEYNKICKKNALMLFSLIENLQEVTFATRLTNSNNELVENEYKYNYTVPRSIFKDYGELSNLWIENQEPLSKAFYNISEEFYFIVGSKKMLVEDIRKLALTGENLTMEQLIDFEGRDVGFGAYVIVYDIENLYTLSVSSPRMTGKPLSVMLSKKSDEGISKAQSIDIRYDDVEYFLKNDTINNESILENNKVEEQKKILLPNIFKIQIKYDNFNYFEDVYKPYETTDVEFIRKIKTMMEQSNIISDKEVKEIDRENNPHAEIVIYDGNKKMVIPYIIDDLYNKIKKVQVVGK